MNYMKTAICDDQPQALEELRRILLRFPPVKKVHAYTDMESFWATIEAGVHYDIVFMDINWEREENGIDFAEKLYQICPYTKVVYVTGYTFDYVEDIFLRHTNLYGLLKKPVNPDQLERILEKLLEEQRVSEGKLLIYYQGGHMTVPFQDILYLESRLHKTCVVLRTREYLCSESLEGLKQQLGAQFLNCHKSYVVNMEYIQEFRGRELVLEGEHVIPVSKARAKASKEQFVSYMASRR